MFAPDLLDSLIAGELPGQKPVDFGLDPRRSITDEAAAAYSDARALWQVFHHRLERLPEDDPATSVTRDSWMIPFFGLLGYETRYNPRAYEKDGMTFAISHRAGEPEDSPPLHIVGARQKLGHIAASGRPRLAPHSLVQEYLNRSEQLWGIVSNGYTLRLLRDCTFVRRQAYVEFDLQALLEEQRFQDFVCLYRLLHRTRLPRGESDAPQCLLEQYYTHSIEQGGRIREHLRDGVEECIRMLAYGFFRHPASGELRRRVSPGCTGNEHVDPSLLYHQLLRLVYRFLFLLVSEDRGLMSPDPIYREHYGAARLCERMEHRAAYSDYDDLWHSLRVLWATLADEKLAALLRLSPLNGELFMPMDLDSASISNRNMLDALRHLTWYQDKPGSPPRRVNYSALDVEELGSVYESLLECHPHIEFIGAAPQFNLTVEGGERRSTGSYYTSSELVAPLIKHALDPVLAERLRGAATPEEKERAILRMKICDPACGSGHFLLAAARRLGQELARVRTGEAEPAPERVREGVRDAVMHCIFGVDKNPLAVELCRVALWLESQAEGRPLTFLDHRIRCGDSLVGVFNLASLERGIPDEAFKPVGRDDRAATTKLRRRNAAERDAPMSQRLLGDQFREIAERLKGMDDLPEETVDHVRVKAEAFQRVETGPDFERLRLACDAWTASFFQPFPNPAGDAVTTETVREVLGGGRVRDARTAGSITLNSLERHFFHWPLAFPEAFAEGGFDVIVGNPPFMGGLKISSEFGDKYRNWMTARFAPFGGTADMCAAFFRLAFDAIKPDGRIGMIATNTLGQGDTRENGLAVILHHGGRIAYARRFVKWPGQANVEVNLAALAKGNGDRVTVLDENKVSFISSRLDSEPESESKRLKQNDGKSFQGSIVLGMGFVLEPAEAEHLIVKDPRNKDCLFPYLNGEDFNSDPEQKPSRYAICFFDWDLEKAKQYPDLCQIIEEKIKPERDILRDSIPIQAKRKKYWWQYGSSATQLYQTIAPLRRVIVRCRVSELHAMAFVHKDWIYSDATVVFAYEDYYHFAMLQSNAHEAWVRRNASTMRTDIRYTPTDCFETFPFPQERPYAIRAEAERVGEEYHEHRRQIMLARRLGLTRIYNLFHDSECQDADITHLRELHAAMDHAVFTCYGWTDLDPGHGFHQNERGQTRFTISPTARRELLRRLLELNLEIAGKESQE
jgi:hypothetical protein